MLIGCLSALAVFLVLAMTTNLSALFVFREPPAKPTHPAHAQSMHSGDIVLEKGNDQCEFRKFDNETGKIVRTTIKPCKDPVVMDAQGIAVPMGTIHRLQAISKAFGSEP